MNRNGSSYLRIVLIILSICLGEVQLSLAQESGKVTLNLRQASLKELFEAIQAQTDMSFVFNESDIQEMPAINLQVKDEAVEDVLQKVFTGQDFEYRVEGKIISVRHAVKKKDEEKKRSMIKVNGRVTEAGGGPLPGVNIWLKGTNVGAFSNGDGYFTITIPEDSSSVLHFSFMGMKDTELAFTGQTLLDVTMESDVAEITEVKVVATGMFKRNTETFTGAATTYTSDALKTVGNQNVLASLKNLDPAFNITENIELGSDPNQLPDIQLRGPSSLEVDIEGEYETSPNQPLFILNGFETTMEKVYDMDMNLVKSITLLKDAAAKAIYGAKAANGVVVIETIQPQKGQLRAYYNGSVDITVPDLTSYNLTNAAQKLEAEVLAGKYTSTNAYEQAALTEQYNELYKEVQRGVNTYWMAQPLRLGVGQKHTLYLDGGDEAMRYSANVRYSNVAGVMIGSDRTTISGDINLSYRYKKLSFQNNLSIDNNKATNSPYGDFSEYSSMNPYYRIYDADGNLIKEYDTGVYNPLYNAGLNSKDESTYTLITENFYGEWRVLDNLRLTGRLGYTQKVGQSDVFIPASHTQYASISTSSDEYLLRGSYTQTNSKSSTVTVDAGLSYTLRHNKHLVYTNAMYNLEQSVSTSAGMTVIGFPSDKMDHIAFGTQYEEGSATGTESTVRSVGAIGSANYSYDNRYLADASYRLNGSSMFGAKERWGNFWSFGLGWNLHHEKFMANMNFINQLKFRASIGYTGSQNFSSYQAISTYSYITDQTYNGDMGVQLLGLANENLQWQQVYDKNVGIDLSLLQNRLMLRFDLYNATTTNLLTDVTLPPSAGFATYRENLGETENKGFEATLNCRVWSQAETRSSLNVFVNVSHNTNKISKISDALKELNDQQDEVADGTGTTDEEVAAQQSPSTRYEEGQSMTALWAVRSLGIDPITGQEVFLTKEGTTTYEWSSEDQVVVGDLTPKLQGNFGANFRHKGFEVNCSFSYQYGAQTYNSTLVSKVENVDVANNNVDVRVLTDRWNTPGVPAKFKSISDNSVTKPTTRFVEDLNELVFSAFSAGYDFSEMKWVQKSPFEYLKLSFNMNDIARLSTVEQEYGLSYPRARVFSFQLQTRF